MSLFRGNRKIHYFKTYPKEVLIATLVVPGAHVSIGTEGLPGGVAGHSQENADITISEAGHKSLILTMKVMAASGLRLFMDKKLRDQARAEHAGWVEKYNK
jgi:hypothetical protein